MTPGTLKAVQVALVEPVAYLTDRVRACRRIIEIEIKGVVRLPVIWVKAVLKEVRSK
jgi:hypothetical protein